MAKCPSCGAPIRWCLTENDRTMPIDPDPDPRGNVVLTGDVGRIGDKEFGRGAPIVHVLKAGELPDGERFMPHFATCPNMGDRARAARSSRQPSSRTAPQRPRLDRSQVGGASTRANAPATSHHAATLVKLGAQQVAVLLDLWDRPDGATAYELASMTGTRTGVVRPGVSPNQVGSRFKELRDLGMIEPLTVDGVEVRRRAAAGQAIVHVATSAGREEALRLAREVEA